MDLYCEYYVNIMQKILNINKYDHIYWFYIIRKIMGSICIKDEHQRMTDNDKKQEEKVRRLKKEGHTCMETMESFPCQIYWCKKTPCENAKDRRKPPSPQQSAPDNGTAGSN